MLELVKHLQGEAVDVIEEAVKDSADSTQDDSRLCSSVKNSTNMTAKDNYIKIRSKSTKDNTIKEIHWKTLKISPKLVQAM